MTLNIEDHDTFDQIPTKRFLSLMFYTKAKDCSTLSAEYDRRSRLAGNCRKTCATLNFEIYFVAYSIRPASTKDATMSIPSCLRQILARTLTQKGAVFGPPVIRLPSGAQGANGARRGGSGRIFLVVPTQTFILRVFGN